MKKIILVFLLLSTTLFADDVKKALEESNKLLKQAYDKIEQLEQEKKDLIKSHENDLLVYKSLLAEANKALAESNDILAKADSRIEKDQIEIQKLRDTIRDLISAGVEVKTYDWNILIQSGYPFNIGLGVSYNLPFVSNVGIHVGVDYFIETQTSALRAGIKFNLGD
jgi:hypothetical protein